jgi:hypothetical protein
MHRNSDLGKTRLALTASLVGVTIGTGCMANNPPSNEGIGPQRTTPNAWGAPVQAPATATMDPMDRGGAGGGGGGGGGGGH